MGQRPDAKVFYGIHYKNEELPEDLADRIREIDPPDLIYEFMGISANLPQQERDKLRGTFSTFTTNGRNDLIVCAFSACTHGWGPRQFSMPPLENFGFLREKLYDIVNKARLPAGKEPTWYLEADFG